MCAVPSAPGVASVRVWAIMSRRRGLRGGDRPPEGVDVDYPLQMQQLPEARPRLAPARVPAPGPIRGQQPALLQQPLDERVAQRHPVLPPCDLIEVPAVEPR